MAFKMIRRVLPLIAVLTALAFPGLAQARWLRAESPHFIVYSDGDETVLRGYVAELEAFDTLLRLYHGIAAPDASEIRKLPIYLVGNIRDLRRVWPEARENIGGFYTYSTDDIYAVAIRARGEDATIKHEYVHHFLSAHGTAAYPAWLNEGYAEFFATTEVVGREIRFGRVPLGRGSNLFDLDWIPLADLLSRRPFSFDTREQQAMFYAQSWLLTHYMLATPERHAQLVDYLARLRRGEGSVVAMQAATHQTAAEMTAALQRYSHGTVNASSTSTAAFPAFDVALTTLPPSADALLLESLRLNRGIEDEQKAALLSTIRQRAAPFETDRLAQGTLALAEVSIGDRAAGEAILARRLAADPADVNALVLMAQSRIDAGRAEEGPARAERFREARTYLVQALAVQPDDFRTLYALSIIRRTAPNYPSDNDLEILANAFALAPQVATIRLTYAEALIRRDRSAGAVRLLEPLANSPHASPEATAAGEMLRRARGGTRPASEPLTEPSPAPST